MHIATSVFRTWHSSMTDYDPDSKYLHCSAEVEVRFVHQIGVYLAGLSFSKDRKNNFLCNYFVQLQYSLGDSNQNLALVHVPHFLFRTLKSAGFVELVDEEKFEQKECDGVIDFILENIGKNYYVAIGLNLYYLKMSQFYRRVHFNHQVFFFGYDKQKKMFAVLGYGEKGWGKYSVHFDEVTESFLETGRLEAYINLGSEREKRIKESVQVAQSMKVLPHCHCQIDPDLIYKQIVNYLAPEDLDDAIYGFDPGCDLLDKAASVLGVSTIYSLIEYFSTRFSFKLQMDMRVFRVFWEHKKVMLLRVQWMTSRGVWDCGEREMSLAKEIEGAAKKLHMMCFAYNLGKMRNDKDLPTSIKKLLEMIVEMEKTLFQFLLKQSERHI